MSLVQDNTLLETRNLALRAGNKPLFGGLDLKLAGGQCLAVLGRNGTGKTTLLHSLARLRHPAGGELRICGRQAGQWSRRQLARRVGIVFQHSHDEMPATVLETALLGRYPHLGGWRMEGDADREMAREALREMELETMAARQVQTLSGGERQRLAIAALLLQQPSIHLLDEPGNHLDIAFQLHALALLRRRAIADDAALIMATHDINLAARFCDRFLLLTGDGEYLLGDRQSVLSPGHLRRAYGCEIHSFETGGRRIFFPA